MISTHFVQADKSLPIAELSDAFALLTKHTEKKNITLKLRHLKLLYVEM